MQPDLPTLIAEAAASERRKYDIAWYERHGQGYYALFLKDGDAPCWRPSSIDEDMLGHDDCEAHLERLVLEAALAKHGCVIVPVEPTGAMLSAGFDARAGFEQAIYRAMIAAGGEP